MHPEPSHPARGWIIAGGLASCIFAVACFYAFIAPGSRGPQRYAGLAAETEPECTSLQCVGDKHIFGANGVCKHYIEALARYGHRWTDDWLEFKFPAFQWRDKEAGIMRYRGNRIELKTAGGRWMRFNYWCDYNVATRMPVDVGAEVVL